MDFLPAAALLDENEARYKLVYMLFDITRIDDSDIKFLSRRETCWIGAAQSYCKIETWTMKKIKA